MAALAEVARVGRPPGALPRGQRGRDGGDRAAPPAPPASTALVFSSTAAVYGDPARVPIEEDDPLAPTNPYGETKLAGERLLADAAARADWRTWRCATSTPAAPTGDRGEDHEPESHLVPLALRAARRRHRAQRLRRRLPDARRHLRARLRPRRRPCRGARPRARGSAGDAGHVQPGHRAGRLGPRRARGGRDGHGPALRRVTAPRRPGTRRRWWRRTSAPGRSLGWRPQRTLADAVRDAWEWMQAHPDGYEDASADRRPTEPRSADGRLRRPGSRGSRRRAPTSCAPAPRPRPRACGSVRCARSRRGRGRRR